MVMILTILGSMQVFVLVLSIVGQGLVYHTEVPVTRILASMTGASRFGYACAQGIVFGLVLMFFSFTLNKISKKFKQE
jgi:ABC-type sugar transport system permease subunit